MNVNLFITDGANGSGYESRFDPPNPLCFPAIMNRTIDTKRLERVMSWSLKEGSHAENEAGELCAMEAVAYIAGEPWADEPACTCPVITTFMIHWNDGLPTDADRDRLLKPLIPSLVGSKADESIQHRRAYLVLDWMLRVQVPIFLELDPAYVSYAQALRNLPEIVDLESARAANPIVLSANDAMNAAEEAARVSAKEDRVAKDVIDGTGDAVLEIAKAVAWEAALETVWHTPGKVEVFSLADTDAQTRPIANPVQASGVQAAWLLIATATGYPTLDPARAAARNTLQAVAEVEYDSDTRAALWEVGRVVGWKVFAPTVERLQASAVDLVRRMIDVRYRS